LDVVYHQSNEGRHQHHTELTSISSEAKLVIHDKLVVFPLVALIMDQVKTLRSRGVRKHL